VPVTVAGHPLFNALAVVDELQADLIRARTREGIQVTKAAGRQRGEHPSAQITKLFRL
jgi:DNA invertase Pin-like site-specific DNA recombinase